MCIKLVNCQDYTEMHGQQNVKKRKKQWSVSHNFLYLHIMYESAVPTEYKENFLQVRDVAATE